MSYNTGIIIQNSGVTMTYSPYEVFNFTGGVVATDAGGNNTVVNISVPTAGAEMYETNSASTTYVLTTANVWYGWNTSVAGFLSNASFSGNTTANKLIIGLAGDYLITFTYAFQITVTGIIVITSVFKNGVVQDNLTTYTEPKSTTNLFSTVVTGIIGGLNVGDTIDVRFQGTATTNILIFHGNLAIHKI